MSNLEFNWLQLKCVIQPFLLVQLHTGGLHFLPSYTGDTDLKMIPGQAIMIIYPDTWHLMSYGCILPTGIPASLSCRTHALSNRSYNHLSPQSHCVAVDVGMRSSGKLHIKQSLQKWLKAKISGKRSVKKRSRVETFYPGADDCTLPTACQPYHKGKYAQWR